MSRVINTENAGKERDRYTKSIVLAMRQLAQQTSINDQTRDLAAFMAIALIKVDSLTDASVLAWEKRGYWVKADKFRMEWMWSGQFGKKLKDAVMSEDWPAVAAISAQVGQKLGNIKLPERHRLGTPWVGAYKHLTSSSSL